MVQGGGFKMKAVSKEKLPALLEELAKEGTGYERANPQIGRFYL
jgi:hypothetical protein